MSCGSIVLADRHPSMLMGIRSLLATEAEVVLMVTDEFSLIEAVIAKEELSDELLAWIKELHLQQ